ncbi:MAG: flagellar hook-basal body complex protein, partial [Planctomycetota bacterium]
MALQRALDSGVSGMLNNQLALDVSANNLANVNTPGFKNSRVSFSNALIQTTFTGSAPGNNIGGRNPRQVGLGVSTTSVDVNFSQGAMAATGRNLDLAVQGEGFFEVNDGTQSFYSRVGNFGIDANDNIVHLSSGYRLQGNTYRTDLNPDGTQTIQEQNVPLTIPQGQAFPPSQTSEIAFQGNLDSGTPALQGTSLQSVYPLSSTLTGSAATEETPLDELNIFHGDPEPAAAADRTKRIYVFGTKPNGESYAGTFEIEPWTTPTGNDATGSLGSLVENINSVLAQGNDRFGSARIENGNLIVSSVGSGSSFSFFMGEDGAVPVGPPVVPASPPITSTTATSGGGGGHLDVDIDATVLDSTTTSSGATVQARGAGLLDPVFTISDAGGGLPAPADFTISINKNGREVGTINVPAGSTAGSTFRLPSFPHVAEGDTIGYSVNGVTPNIDITADTRIVLDSNANNLTQDLDGDSVADMFEEDSPVDANAWQYENTTNNTFDWYRARLVPELTSTSIEVFDSQGGSHNIEFRFFRIGTRTESESTARINSWDVIINVPEGEGELIDDLVTGIEFDQFGRFTGSVGTTIHNT